jgi:hypothetical protein
MCPDGCIAGRPEAADAPVQESLAAIVSRVMTVDGITWDPWAEDHAVGFHLRGGGRETRVWLSPALAGLWPGLYVIEGQEPGEGRQQYYVHLTYSATPGTRPGDHGQPAGPPAPAPDAWSVWGLSRVVTSDDGATVYVPWASDRAVGYCVTSPGQAPVYVCLSPAAGPDADARPGLLLYAGPLGTADDSPVTVIRPFGPDFYPAGQDDAGAEGRQAAAGGWAGRPDQDRIEVLYRGSAQPAVIDAPGDAAARIWDQLHADPDGVDLAVWRTPSGYGTPGGHVVQGLFGALVPDASLARAALMRAYRDDCLVTVQAVAAFRAFLAAEAAQARSGADRPDGQDAGTGPGPDPLFAEVPGVIEHALIRAALATVCRYRSGPWPAAAAYLIYLAAHLDGGAVPAAPVTADEARAAALTGHQVSIAQAIGVTDADTVKQVEQLMLLDRDDLRALDAGQLAELAIGTYAGWLGMTGDERMLLAAPGGALTGRGRLAAGEGAR